MKAAPESTDSPAQADRRLASAKYRAWATEPEDQTPEQQELVSRPEVQAAGEAVAQRIVPQLRERFAKLMLEHPEALRILIEAGCGQDGLRRAG